MLPDVIAQIQTWDEIVADFQNGWNWIIYVTMPLIAMFVGWSTKILALWMMYYPIERKGLGWLSWQGIVPMRAGKLASITIKNMTDSLLDPEELLGQVDAKKAVEQMREPLTRAVDEMARELAEQVRPGLWDSLPDGGRQAVQKRVQAAAPAVVDSLLDEMKRDLTLYVDIQYLAVTTLVKNKAKMNGLIKGMAGGPQDFLKKAGLWFGLAIGLVQVVAWALFLNPWIMPIFGFACGFLSDYIALNLMFRPMYPKKFGPFTFQGVIYKNRSDIQRNYAKVMAEDIFAPDVFFEAVLHGPTSDRLFSTIEREVSRAIDTQVGVAGPLVTLAVGTEKYRAIKASIIDRVMAKIPVAMDEAMEGAGNFSIEGMIHDNMAMLTNEQFEEVMRPIFKDDEMLLVLFGAFLGFAVGEMQVLVVEQLHQPVGGH